MSRVCLHVYLFTFYPHHTIFNFQYTIYLVGVLKTYLQNFTFEPFDLTEKHDCLTDEALFGGNGFKMWDLNVTKMSQVQEIKATILPYFFDEPPKALIKFLNL